MLTTFKTQETETMTNYSEHRPTVFDSHIQLEDREHWLMAPVTQTRDSGPLDLSNFAQFLAALGGESDTVEVHRFGHWGPGWYEIIIVDPTDTERVKTLEDTAEQLADYPVLDESDLSAREFEDFCDSWRSWACREFVRNVADAFGLGDAARNRLEDIDQDAAREFYMEHASEPYYSESSGVCVPTGRCAHRMTRDDCAALLMLSR
jgi:hypothetical protein